MIGIRALFLAFAWIALTGELSPLAFAEAASIGIGGALLSRGRRPPVRIFRRLPAACSLVLFLLKELVIANARVAVAVVRGSSALSPAFVPVPLDFEDKSAIALLANLVTLTPGTLSVDVTEDRRTLWVHALDGSDPERVRRSIQEGFQRRVRALYS